ncbi:hypothetical protein D3C80_1920040 [compost metagenome]
MILFPIKDKNAGNKVKAANIKVNTTAIIPSAIEAIAGILIKNNVDIAPIIVIPENKIA